MLAPFFRSVTLVDSQTCLPVLALQSRALWLQEPGEPASSVYEGSGSGQGLDAVGTIHYSTGQTCPTGSTSRGQTTAADPACGPGGWKHARVLRVRGLTFWRRTEDLATVPLALEGLDLRGSP